MFQYKSLKFEGQHTTIITPTAKVCLIEKYNLVLYKFDVIFFVSRVQKLIFYEKNFPHSIILQPNHVYYICSNALYDIEDAIVLS